MPRHRLRWCQPETPGYLLHDTIQPHDSVEILCLGVSVPRVWLESRVSKVLGNLYCVGNVLSPSGVLWVERSSLRLIKSRKINARQASSDSSSSSRPDSFSFRDNFLTRAVSRLSQPRNIFIEADAPFDEARAPLSDQNFCSIM